jgi:transcriptional regulator with XRE-family HTH domain
MKTKGESQDPRLAVFAKRLLDARVKKGWNQSETARNAALHMPDKKFGRDNVSKYEMGKHLPTPLQLNALAKALGVAPDALVPGNPGIADVMEPGMKPAFRTIDDDTVWVRINAQFPRKRGLEIFRLAEQEDEG